MVTTFSITATGEPAVCMSIVVLFALRHALDSARKDAGVTEKWFNLGEYYITNTFSD